MSVACSVGGRRSGSGAIFFFNDTATTEIYTLSLHDALPISAFIKHDDNGDGRIPISVQTRAIRGICSFCRTQRSEEHTSELQSQSNLVCRLLLEKKNRQASLAASRMPELMPWPRNGGIWLAA